MCPFMRLSLDRTKICRLSEAEVPIEQRDYLCTKDLNFLSCNIYRCREQGLPEQEEADPAEELVILFRQLTANAKKGILKHYGNLDAFVSAMLDRYHEYAPRILRAYTKNAFLEPTDPIVAVSIKNDVIFDYLEGFQAFPWGGSQPREGSLMALLRVKPVSTRKAAIPIDDYEIAFAHVGCAGTTRG